jgi:tRNA 2-thiouridine synthesizing protein A
MEFNQELDARGLNCPLHMMRIKKSMSALTTGQVLKITCTDSGSVKDMQVFAKQTGDELLSSAESAGEFIFYLKKH